MTVFFCTRKGVEAYCQIRTLIYPLSSEASANRRLPELHIKVEKSCFQSMTRHTKITGTSTALFTRKFFFHPMPRRNMQTGQRSGTLRRKWKSNGTPSLPDDLFSPSPERYQVNSIRRWSGTTAKNTLSQKECAVTLPSTIPTHRDTIHIAM